MKCTECNNEFEAKRSHECLPCRRKKYAKAYRKIYKGVWSEVGLKPMRVRKLKPKLKLV